MNLQMKAFHISFLLHGLVIALAVVFSTFTVPCKRTLVVDFGLLKPAGPAPLMGGKLVASEAPQPVVKKEPLPLPQKKPRVASAFVPAPAAPLVADLPEVPEPDSRPVEPGIPDYAKAMNEESGAGDGTGKAEDFEEGAGGGGNGYGRKEAANRRYVKDHFAYIRDKILRGVTYPDAARRMGWQGRVVLSFVIMTDGSVQALKIMQSSGFTMLDKNAAEAVHDTAPFPKPPCEARLVIPISYRLR